MFLKRFPVKYLNFLSWKKNNIRLTYEAVCNKRCFVVPSNQDVSSAHSAEEIRPLSRVQTKLFELATSDGDILSSPINESRGKIEEKTDSKDLETLLADAVTPLWRLPYSEQLKVKDQRNFQLLKKLTTKLKQESPNISQILCQLLPTVPSPSTVHYRNKNEFHIKYDENGEVVVGLVIGKASLDSLHCIKSDKLLNTHPTHSSVASRFQSYVSNSKWKVCEHFQLGGHWRHLIVRSNHLNELMLIVIIHPQQAGEEEIRQEMEDMAKYMVANCQDLSLKSIYYQACVHTRCSAEQSPFVLLHGEPHIYEKIGDFSFRISPESFFQINTQGARVLYEVVGDELKIDSMTTLLDICCGTGTQGLMLTAKRRFRGLIGIEASRSAIEDAKFNATLNGIHCAEFYAGRVEKLLKPVLNQLETAPSISAIVNPSRNGLDNRVIRLIRDNERIRRLVYISCQPDGPAMDNFVELCQKKRSKDKTQKKIQPFRLVSAIPVDMFPHTDHCELVLTFER